MAFPDLTEEFFEAAPGLRGRLTANAPLKELMWFRVGGPAQVLFEPEDEDDLIYLLRRTGLALPITVIGMGSNLLVRDGGVPGIVIRLGNGFGGIDVGEDCRIRVGAGVPEVKVARAAAEASISGLAFYRGIPGCIGGALRMNSGAYGCETQNVLVYARAVDRKGRVHELGVEELNYSYRHCGASDELIFTSALFQGEPGDPEAIAAVMADITETRSATQPVNARTGGSTFKNPPEAKAWELIEQAGCRGLTVGGAQVSEQHCNFMINDGSANAADLEALGEIVRARVRKSCGVLLQWEIQRIGMAKAGHAPLEVAAHTNPSVARF